MMLHNKILPVALVAALLGGTVGALVMHNRNTAPSDAQVASANFVPNSTTQPARPPRRTTSTRTPTARASMTASQRRATARRATRSRASES